MRRTLLLLALSQVLVAQAPSAVSILTSLSPSPDGATIAITATVTPPSATGLVTFYDRASVLGSSAVSAGRAILTKHFSAPGLLLLRAHYTGDSVYAASDSASVPQIDPHRPEVHPRSSMTSTLPSFLISTLAGQPIPPTSLPATLAALAAPEFAAIDQAGNLYLSDAGFNAVFRVDATGVLSRVAGIGVRGYSGDGGQAVVAPLSNPLGIAFDTSGNLFIADANNGRVRRVSPAGIITTVAGGGSASGDGIPATQAMMTPYMVAVDASGNLFIDDLGYNRIRKVNAAGIITTVAGNGTYGYSPDGTPATQASLGGVEGIALDATGNLFFSDSSNNRVRTISGGNLVTVAGNGTTGYSGDGGPATGAGLSPLGIAFDTVGNLYVVDNDNALIRKVTPRGIISTVAGASVHGYSGDGGPALAAWLNPSDVALDSSGNLYIAEFGNRRIRKVAGGLISTVAGGGSGQGAKAPQTMFVDPRGVTKDQSGNWYVSDQLANRVYRVDPSGTPSIVAGTGSQGPSLYTPGALAVDSAGALYIADYARIQKLSATAAITVAGNYQVGYSGDGGQATAASLGIPSGLAFDSGGSLYFSDSLCNCVRKITPAGIITTVAGNGTAGYSGDGLPAISAKLNSPTGVAVDSAGNLYIADSQNGRIRMVDPKGIITTVAGAGQADGALGDGGLATNAALVYPDAITVDSPGNLYIADAGNGRVRMVSAGGIIATIAGGGPNPDPGANGQDALGYLLVPQGVVADIGGNVYVTDNGSHAVLLLTPQGGPPTLSIVSSHTDPFALDGTGQYTLTVSNAAVAGPTSGTVAVTEFPPAGMTLSLVSDNGWSCDGNACTRDDTLLPGLNYPPITVNVSVSPSGPSQATNLATVGGGGAALVGVEDFTTLCAPPTTIQTNPSALQFSVDGLPAQIAPQAVPLTPGLHLMAVPSPQAGGAGTRFVFGSWSDSGSQSHNINVTATAVTYTAAFQTQYQFNAGVVPLGAGSVAPPTGSFFNAGSIVNAAATGFAPYVFSYWSGAASGNTNIASLTLSAPLSVVANFVSADFNQDGKVDVKDVQQIVNEALGIAEPTNDMNHDGSVNINDIQILVNAVLGWY